MAQSKAALSEPQYTSDDPSFAHLKFTPSDLQFLETRKFSHEEIAQGIKARPSDFEPEPSWVEDPYGINLPPRSPLGRIADFVSFVVVAFVFTVLHWIAEGQRPATVWQEFLTFVLMCVLLAIICILLCLFAPEGAL